MTEPWMMRVEGALSAMQYLNDRLNAGWHPDQDTDHLIYIGNPR